MLVKRTDMTGRLIDDFIGMHAFGNHLVGVTDCHAKHHALLTGFAGDILSIQFSRDEVKTEFVKAIFPITHPDGIGSGDTPFDFHILDIDRQAFSHGHGCIFVDDCGNIIVEDTFPFDGLTSAFFLKYAWVCLLFNFFLAGWFILDRLFSFRSVFFVGFPLECFPFPCLIAFISHPFKRGFCFARAGIPISMDRRKYGS